jgi:hypothetical protein
VGVSQLAELLLQLVLVRIRIAMQAEEVDIQAAGLEVCSD